MKTPIEVKDILKGDLIRCEKDGNDFPVAVEYVASGDAQTYWASGYVCDFYLLDRPTPPVELPTEPTLGWLTTDYEYVEPNYSLAFIHGVELSLRLGRAYTKLYGGHGTRERITAFTPAVAVPKVALDELRTAENVVRGVNRFLAAVDRVNPPADDSERLG